ncbi:hypothetical protein C7374_105158 [Falsochrobactrum ovis]|uniref:Uncharacterized protein n=1 Tax=Falsochrobactrum ovis TaxID=1293442 RepID=A0A364JVW7_9HYPH|nr:hypothetical protein C7374_105158 [Falsochrobactrum ovis]
MKPIYGPRKKSRKKSRKKTGVKTKAILRDVVTPHYTVAKRNGKWCVYSGQEVLATFDYYKSCFIFIQKHQPLSGP